MEPEVKDRLSFGSQSVHPGDETTARVVFTELNGSFSPDDEERLDRAIAQPARLDLAVVQSLSTILAVQRRTEDTVGSASMLDAATAHLRLIIHLVKNARGPLAAKLAATASDASQFVGWLHAATGAHATAGPLYDQSLRLGLQAGDNDLAATALSMRGHLAWVTDDLGAMADLSQAAEDLAVSSATRATAVQQRAKVRLGRAVQSWAQRTSSQFARMGQCWSLRPEPPFSFQPTKAPPGSKLRWHRLLRASVA